MITYEADVRNALLGRIWFPTSPKIRLMPGYDTARAIVEDDRLWEARGKSALEAIEAATKGKRVLIVIHGYNSADKNVRPSYATLFNRMNANGLLDIHYDLVVFLYWPGGTGPGYWLARMRTGAVGEQLRVLIKAMKSTVYLDIQTHSLGAKCALEALKNGDLVVRNLIMAAAAVQDDDCVIGGKYAASINTLGGRALAPYSSADNVLGGAFELAELDKALGSYGPQPGKELPLKLKCVDASEWGKGHSVFREADNYYKLWLDFLEGRI